MQARVDHYKESAHIPLHYDSTDSIIIQIEVCMQIHVIGQLFVKQPREQAQVVSGNTTTVCFRGNSGGRLNNEKKVVVR